MPDQNAAALTRHRAVYDTPGLPPFQYDRVSDRLYAGRNPLTACDVVRLAGEGITPILDLDRACTFLDAALRRGRSILAPLPTQERAVRRWLEGICG